MSFHNRLALFLMVTLVCVQAATAMFAYSYLRQQVLIQGRRELSSAMQALTRQIDLLSQRVSEGVQVLSLDYALRAAIANSDHGTELSVLRNHGRRIGASEMMLVRLDGSVAADTAGSPRAGAAFPFATLLTVAETQDRGTALIALRNRIYWIVVVPVRAPIPIAFIAACIPLDGNLLDQMQRISSSPHAVMLLAKGDDGRWRIAAHTRGDSGWTFPAIAAPLQTTMLVTRNGSEMLESVSPLRTARGSRPVEAVIEFPLEEALRPYRGLITPMLLMLALALLVASGGATLIVRRVARPLEALASAAQRIAAGDYSWPMFMTVGRDEIGRLAAAIADMIRAIAEREAALTGAMETAQTARDEAVKANEAKSQFLANMSHELRTPLNAIVGFSEMLEGEVLGPLGNLRYRDYARDIRASGEHLRGLFERMLDLAQAESKTLAPGHDTFAAANLLREALETHRTQARRARVGIVLQQDAEGAVVHGDFRKLRQSFANIIHNAIKFTPPGGTVTVTSQSGNDRLSVRIADTGVGIEPNLLKSISKPFQRLRSALDGQHQGAGLGLAFAKAIVELHGGTVSVESTVGQGTIVGIELPLAGESVGRAA